MKYTTTLFAVAALAPFAPAQGLPWNLPFEYSGDLYVTDSSSDSIKRCVDLDLNGDFNGVGEVTDFYSDSVGPLTLGNNSGISVDISGRLFVSDTTENNIYVLHDGNGNGNCHDAGEIAIFFNGDPALNLSGLELATPNDLTVDAAGTVYIAEANTSSVGIDSIVRLIDTNGDGDANDAGEATRYFTPVTAGSTGDSVPNDVFVGQDGFLYYVEGGSSGLIAKDVYRLDDIDGNGVIDPLTEVTSFFSPPAQTGTPFFWCLTQDRAGNFYVADTGNDLIWRFADTDGNGVVDPLTEATIWWTAPAKSLIWDLTAASDGSIYAAESQSPDRVLRLFDANGDGVVDPVTEVTEAYSELLSATNIVNPRGLIFEQQPNVELPASLAVGASFTIDTRATMGDIYAIYWSAATMPPLPLAPFGYLELSFLPGLSGKLFSGVIGTNGIDVMPFAVPNDPALSGSFLFLQGFAGKLDRFQLTNLAQTVVL